MSITVASLNVLNARGTLAERLPRLSHELRLVVPAVFLAQEVLNESEGPERIERRLGEAIERAGLSCASIGRLSWAESASAVFYRSDDLRLLDAGVIEFATEPAYRDTAPDIPWAVFEPLNGGRRLVVFSVHLAWGGLNEVRRLTAAKTMERYAAHLSEQHADALVIAAGDFNTIPAADTIRFLTGLAAEDPGAYWVDVWSWLRPQEPGITQDPTTLYAAQTAASVGILRPELLPKRRIDYLMLRGWSYARVGSDPKVSAWGVNTSDHTGLRFTFDL